MSPNTPMGEPTRDPIGTGPYVFDNWAPGENITLVRNADYWGEAASRREGDLCVAERELLCVRPWFQPVKPISPPNIAVQDATDPEMDFSYPNSETSRLRIDTTRPAAGRHPCAPSAQSRL